MYSIILEDHSIDLLKLITKGYTERVELSYKYEHLTV
jgi:hypothetical protein